MGIQKITISLHNDDRGFLGEIFRQDWNDILPDFDLKQVLISQSKPGKIRAWHRHLKNQLDLLFVRKGVLKICAYDGDKNSETFSKLGLEFEKQANLMYFCIGPALFSSSLSLLGESVVSFQPSLVCFGSSPGAFQPPWAPRGALGESAQFWDPFSHLAYT